MIKLLFVISIILQFSYGYGFNIQPRIMNGYRSNPQDFTFYVYIKSFFEHTELFATCGATLISDRCVFGLAFT